MKDDTAPVLTPMLRKLTLWAHLDADDERALLGLPHSLVTVPRDEPIVREGDRISHCWLVLSGFSRATKMSATAVARSSRFI